MTQTQDKEPARGLHPSFLLITPLQLLLFYSQQPVYRLLLVWSFTHSYRAGEVLRLGPQLPLQPKDCGCVLADSRVTQAFLLSWSLPCSETGSGSGGERKDAALQMCPQGQPAEWGRTACGLNGVISKTRGQSLRSQSLRSRQIQESNQAHSPPGTLHSLGSVELMELGQTGCLMRLKCLPLNKKSNAHWYFFLSVSI